MLGLNKLRKFINELCEELARARAIVRNINDEIEDDWNGDERRIAEAEAAKAEAAKAPANGERRPVGRPPKVGRA